VVGYPKLKSIRLPQYRAYLKTLPCTVCQRVKTEHLDIVPAHQGFRHGGTSIKNNDTWALPLCVECHEEEHRGSETFWRNFDRKMEIIKCLTGYILRSNL